jgi:hypothetical protein
MLIVEHKKLPHRWESFHYPNGSVSKQMRLSLMHMPDCHVH